MLALSGHLGHRIGCEGHALRGDPVTHGDPILIRYHGSTPYEFHCACGHIAESLQGHDAHLAEIVQRLSKPIERTLL